jgi:hypothetical protein
VVVYRKQQKCAVNTIIDLESKSSFSRKSIKSKPQTMIDSLLLVIIFISILVSCGKSCRQRRQRLRENELEATAPTTQQGSNGAPGPENENERTAEQRNQMLHDRRLKILTTLVHKVSLTRQLS